VILSSRTAISKNELGSRAQFNLPTSPEVTTDTQTCILSLLHFHCPNSIYNIHARNCNVNVWIVKTGTIHPYVTIPVSVSVPLGGYDVQFVNPLITALNNLMSKQDLLKGIEFSFDSSAAHVQLSFSKWITNHSDPTLVGIYFLPENSSIFPTLGFLPRQLVSVPGNPLQLAWGIGGGGAALQTQLLVAMGLPKLKTPDLLLKIDQFNTGNRASGFSIGEVFHVIHPNSVFGDIINYYPPVGFENHIPRFTLNGILNIQFTDWNNEDIDFNGEDWTLALGVKWGVDTGIAGFETSNLDLNYRPLTHQYPRHYDPLDGNKKRLRR